MSISSVDQETDHIYPPSREVLEGATIKNRKDLAQRAARDLAGFWGECALDYEWYAPWEKVLDDSNKPFYKWFVGAKVNIVAN
jgi:acetyl-CoA synthetase